jgi:CRISPR/Cas system-associated exonuclease Cas4 (RecB family)
MARGTDIHAKAEHFVAGTIRGVPPALKGWGPELEGLKRAGAKVEEWWAVSPTWQPMSTPSSQWLVGKTDAYVLENEVPGSERMGGGKVRKKEPAQVTVIDYKTGRIYGEKHQAQASLYASLAKAYFPSAVQVHVEFWYLDQNHVLPWTYGEAKLKDLQRIWRERGEELLSAKKFPTKPGKYPCKWCAYGKSKGGPCKDEVLT